VRILSHIDLKIPRGIVYGLIGPRGSGKTSLLRVLLSQEKPTAGQVFVLGEDVSDRGYLARVGCMRHEHGLIEILTVERNLKRFSRSCGLKRSDFSWHEERILSELGMNHLRNRPVRSLDFDSKRLVSLACAELGNPEVLLLDEPMVGSSEEFERVLRKNISLRKNTGRTTIVATDRLTDASMCDAACFLDRGKIVREMASAEQ
jgi:ABC-2 type transport system ATP-binding protein